MYENKKPYLTIGAKRNALPVLLLLVGIFYPDVSLAQTASKTHRIRTQNQLTGLATSAAEYLNVNAVELFQINTPNLAATNLRSPLMVKVPIAGSLYTLVLAPHSVRSDQYQLIIQREDGAKYKSFPSIS